MLLAASRKPILLQKLPTQTTSAMEPKTFSDRKCYLPIRHLLAAVALVVLSAPAGYSAATVTPVDSVLAVFNNRPNAKSGNAFFRLLDAEGFTDEPISLPDGASHDTLCSTVWYWAAEWYYDVQVYTEAEQYALRSLPLCKAAGDKTMEADCASLLGLIYVRLGEFDKAAIYAKQCNELDIESGNSDNIASSYNTLAGIYMSMRQPDEAEKYVLEAERYCKEAGNQARLAVIYGMASEVYQHKKMPEKTLDYATRAWKIEKQLGRPDKAAVRQTQRAAALIMLARYDEAEQCLQEAIPVIEASGNLHSLGIAYNHMGDLLYVQGRNREGADYYYKALDIFTAQHDLYNESHTRKGLRETLRGINPEEALLHGDRYEHLRDSIYDQHTNQHLSQYAAQYGNDILQQLNRRQRIRYIWLTVLIVLLFMIFALTTWLLYRRQQKRQVEHFNNLLTEVEKLRQQSRARKKLESLQTREPEEKPSDEESPSEESGADADDKLFLVRVVELVKKGMPRGDFSVELLADALHISVSTFRRRMLNATGDSPKNFILAIQMEKATELLMQQPALSIGDIAFSCGFAEAGSFTRTFHRFYGLTPTQYREQQKA